MGKLDSWQICDELSVVQAVLLILEIDPNTLPHVLKLQEDEKPENFSAIFTALTNAINGNRLNATIRKTVIFLEHPTVIDWDLTTILVDDLRKWLESRNIKTGFFFPQSENAPDYLDKNHEHYAPKLNAAIKAWQAVNADPKLSAGKTVSQALSNWLRKNVEELGLVKPDRKPNEQALKEIAKISNWNPKGGAPKTPS